jgi:hypothetical protein
MKFVWGDENLLELGVVMAISDCVYAKYHLIVWFKVVKMVAFLLRQLFLSKHKIKALSSSFSVCSRYNPKSPQASYEGYRSLPSASPTPQPTTPLPSARLWYCSIPTTTAPLHICSLCLECSSARHPQDVPLTALSLSVQMSAYLCSSPWLHPILHGKSHSSCHSWFFSLALSIIWHGIHPSAHGLVSVLLH